MESDARERIVAAVRRACLEAAVHAYEDAGMAGLCAEGRWEAALDAIRSLDASEIEDGSHGGGEAAG